MQIPCEKLEIHEIEVPIPFFVSKLKILRIFPSQKPSKPGAILMTITKTNISYLIAPIFENEKLTMIKQNMQQFKERIVEFGGSEREKLGKSKKNSAFASLAPEIAFKSMASFRSRLEMIGLFKKFSFFLSFLFC